MNEGFLAYVYRLVGAGSTGYTVPQCGLMSCVLALELPLLLKRRGEFVNGR